MATARWLERRGCRSVTGWSKAGPVVGTRPRSQSGPAPAWLDQPRLALGCRCHFRRGGVGVDSLVHALDQGQVRCRTRWRSVAWRRCGGWASRPPWIRPRSIGDTINLAVTATDPRGNALLGAPTVWSSSDSSVASVDSAGTRRGSERRHRRDHGYGRRKVATAHVVVRQQPAEVRIVGDSRPAGTRRGARQGRGIRGGRAPAEDPGLGGPGGVPPMPSIAAVDSLGNVTGIAPGRTSFTAIARGAGHPASGGGLSGARFADAAGW